MSEPSFFDRLFQKTSQVDRQPIWRRKHLGFVELSAGQNPTVDIVAIHGLDGHREQSWTADDGTMWLRDLLPEDIPNARIMSYGYDADTRSFTQTSTQTIFHHAEAFAESLSRQRTADPERPIIFLAHSLGGIILKKALVHCHIRSHKSGHRLRSIITSTLAVLFFGTPHSGANGVQLVEWMCRLLSIYMSTTNKVLRDLKRDSSALEELQAHYLPASEGIDTIFFYEAYETPIAGGLSQMIVPRHSAIIAGDREANVVALNADHCQIVKFSGKDDESYRTVAHYIRGFMEQGPAKIRENWIRENSHRGIAKGELPGTQAAVTPKPLLPISRNFVQRPSIDEFLTRHLLPISPLGRQPRCILHGLGGGGKTQLASSWVEAHKHRFNRIFVVDASNKQQIEADLEIAIRSMGPHYIKSSWKDMVAYLSGQRGWLLYFDNADSPDLHLDDYFPISIHGAILVTTRNRDCINYAPDSHVEVGMLTEKEAVELLHKVADVTPSSNDVSITIVNELGMWALAIAQAGAYIFKTRRLDTYLATFRRHRETLLRDASLKGRNYKGSTYTAFDLSFGQLPIKAQELMKICAFLHHSSIPLSLFERSTTSGFRTYTVVADCPPPESDEAIISQLKDALGSEWDEHSFQELIDSISRGSLVNISIDNDGQVFYSLHPLVQAYIRDILTPIDQERYARSASQLLLGVTRPLLDGEANGWYRQLLFHIDGLPRSAKLAHASHALIFRMVYESVGNWTAKQEIDDYCYSQFHQKFGPKHPATVTAMSHVAWTLRLRGQLEEAEKMEREVLALQAEILGEKHIDTVTAKANLSTTLCLRNKLEEAEKMEHEILAVLQETLGEKHPGTVKAMSRLAAIHRLRDQLEEAEKMEQEVLTLLGGSLGGKHPDTVLAMANLAATIRLRGRLEEAEKMEREVLALLQEILGGKHPETVRTMSRLAAILRLRGQLEEAKKMEREGLALLQETLGGKHPDTAAGMANLAITLRLCGELHKAEKMEREVLALLQEISGGKHPDTIRTMSRLGEILRQFGRHDEAVTMEREALALMQEVLGTKHPDSVAAMANLATTLRLLYQLEEAEEIEREVVALLKGIYGGKHLETASAMSRLAATLHFRGRLREAEKIEREVLASLKDILGKKHPETVSAMADLAATLSLSGQLDEGEKIERKVLALRKEIYGEKHLETVTAMSHLAITLRSRGQLKQAEKIEREVVTSLKGIHGLKHVDTVSAMSNLAVTTRHRGQLEEAEKMEREVLVLFQELLGRKHPDTVRTMSRLAEILRIRGQLEDAERMEREVLALLTEVLGGKHADAIAAMANLAATLWLSGQLEEAEKLQQEVLVLQTEAFGPQHPGTIYAKNNHARMVSKLGRRQRRVLIREVQRGIYK